MKVVIDYKKFVICLSLSFASSPVILSMEKSQYKDEPPEKSQYKKELSDEEFKKQVDDLKKKSSLQAILGNKDEVTRIQQQIKQLQDEREKIAQPKAPEPSTPKIQKSEPATPASKELTQPPAPPKIAMPSAEFIKPSMTEQKPSSGQKFLQQQAETEAEKAKAEEEQRAQKAAQFQSEAKEPIFKKMSPTLSEEAAKLEEKRKKEAERKAQEAAQRQSEAESSPKETEKLEKQQEEQIQSKNLSTDSGKKETELTQLLKKYGIPGSIVAALLGGGGTGGGIFGAQAKEESPEGTNAQGGILPPSTHQAPPVGDADYDNKLFLIANAYSAIKNQFKQALQNSDYNSSTFEIILDKVKIGTKEESVGLRYIFKEGGSGSLDVPLTPVMIEIFPDSIDDYEVTPERLISKIEDSESKDFTTMLLNPSSAFIAFLMLARKILGKKVINLDSPQAVIAWVNSVLFEGVLLFYRLTLDQSFSQLSIQSILASLPLWLQTYSNEQKAKMFCEMVTIYSESRQVSSATENVVNDLIKPGTYKQKVTIINDRLLPLIKNDLPYSDRLLLVHAILKLISDLGAGISKDADVQISNRLDELIPVISNAKTLMTNAKFEQTITSKVTTALSTLNDIKAGKKTLQQNIKKPRLGESIVDVKDYSMTTILNVCLQHFLKIFTQKFEGDFGFLPLYDKLPLGRGDTEDKMLAIWIRCLKDAKKADSFLYKTTETVVPLRTFNNPFFIDPGKKYNELVTPKINDLQKATNDLDAAIKALKASKASENIKNYKKLKEIFDNALQKCVEAQHSFTRAYSVNYPLEQNEGPARTVAEFAQKEFEKLQKIGLYDDALFDSAFVKFEPILGLQKDMIWGQGSK